MDIDNIYSVQYFYLQCWNLDGTNKNEIMNAMKVLDMD